nr:bifunctional phosphoglucose/phosphomannose isomerase [Clostridia bacterium]
MLDNPKRIEKIDQSNMRKLLLQFPSQCEKAVQLAEKFTIPEQLFQKSDKIVVCGLGGSAIGGDI